MHPASDRDLEERRDGQAADDPADDGEAELEPAAARVEEFSRAVHAAYRGIGPWPAMHSPLAFWLMSAAALALTAALFLGLLALTVRRPRSVSRPAVTA